MERRFSLNDIPEKNDFFALKLLLKLRVLVSVSCGNCISWYWHYNKELEQVLGDWRDNFLSLKWMSIHGKYNFFALKQLLLLKVLVSYTSRILYNLILSKYKISDGQHCQKNTILCIWYGWLPMVFLCYGESYVVRPISVKHKGIFMVHTENPGKPEKGREL